MLKTSQTGSLSHRRYLYHGRIHTPGTGALLSDFIAVPWKRETQSNLETKRWNTPYYLFVAREEYKYNEFRIKKKGMKTYYDNVLKEKNTALGFPRFKNGEGVQKHGASMPHDQALGEWKLHTLEDMRWNDNHQWPIKYWSRDIIRTMRLLIWQPAHGENLIYAPQHHVDSYTPPKRLYREMHTADWWWETQVRRDTRG
jgi:hypothetical protein